MKTLKNIEGTTLVNIGIMDAEGTSAKVFFNGETGEAAAIFSESTWKLLTEPLNVIDILNEEAPGDNLREEFALLLGREVNSLSLCANECERPWNIEPNAVRCGYCGGNLLGHTALDQLQYGHTYSVGRYRWAFMAKALAFARENKVKIYYVGAVDDSCFQVLMGWDNPYAFKASGTTTFRGKVNVAVYDEIAGDSEDLPEVLRWFVEEDPDNKIVGFQLVQSSPGFLRFVEDHGAKLVEDPYKSVDPARENESRAQYIHNLFINGAYYTQSGEQMKPERRFTEILYKSNLAFASSEIATESAWEVYCGALDAAGKSATIHKDGTISWRFMAAIEAITADALYDFLIGRFGAEPEEVAFLLKEDDSE